MSKFKKIISNSGWGFMDKAINRWTGTSVGEVTGLMDYKKNDVSVPTAALPKPPEEAVSSAETPVILVPNEDVKNQRVSGRSAKRKTNSVDVLGGLGKSGLNI